MERGVLGTHSLILDLSGLDREFSCHWHFALSSPLVEVLEVQSEPLKQGDFVMHSLPSWGRMRGSAMTGAHHCHF